MAVVIAKYIPTNGHARGKAKGNIRYIEHRPGKDGARIWRTLFNEAGRMSREEAYTLIDNAEPGSVFWRIRICPDAAKEDTNHDLSMQELTDRTIQTLQEYLGTSLSYVAAIHADHTALRHIHVLAILPKLSPQEFRSLPDMLRNGATLAAGEQRQELDQIQDHHQKEQEREVEQWERSQEKGGAWE